LKQVRHINEKLHMLDCLYGDTFPENFGLTLHAMKSKRFLWRKNSVLLLQVLLRILQNRPAQHRAYLNKTETGCYIRFSSLNYCVTNKFHFHCCATYSLLGATPVSYLQQRLVAVSSIWDL